MKKKNTQGKNEVGRVAQKLKRVNKKDLRISGKQGIQGKAVKGQWSRVPIEEELLSNKDFENLVSFEELHDYNVVTKEDGTKGSRRYCKKLVNIL